MYVYFTWNMLRDVILFGCDPDSTLESTHDVMAVFCPTIFSFI